MEKQKILDALTLIKDICDKNNDCEDCPFCCANCCILREDIAPQDWKLNNADEKWRAFKL